MNRKGLAQKRKFSWQSAGAELLAVCREGVDKGANKAGAQVEILEKRDDVQKISVLILTLNEGRNIRNCLECVKWADEIIIVDSFSDDETTTIAREYTDKIFTYRRTGYADPARQFALEQASNEWILAVDADELVPRKLRDRLMELSTSEYEAVLIPRKNYYWGHLMQGADLGDLQDLHVRFFKKHTMHYSDKIHDFVRLDENTRIYKLLDESCAFIHFNYVDFGQYLERLDRYTTIEAKSIASSSKSISTVRLSFSLLYVLARRFIVMKGYRDGVYGFAVSILSSVYVLIAALKSEIFRHYQSTNLKVLITKQYQDIADEHIRKYEEAEIQGNV
jgi:glycosyltransferase involved in cell wall biosynthesis